MLNIISRSIVSNRTSGPHKVVVNLIKGLDEIGYPYVVNAQLDACTRVWVHDDIDALKEVVKIKDVAAIVGPNLYVTPRQIPNYIDISKVLYLHPAPWVIDMWKEGGFNRAPLAAWPTGIDTDIFIPKGSGKNNVLIYFKERFPEELAYAEELLTSKNISYTVIQYGKYTEEEYQKLLENSRYIIWIGRQESQGIALEEALSTNVPILVWDVPHLGHWQSNPSAMAVFNEQENTFTGATSAYYFDKRCGLIIRDRNTLSEDINYLEKNWGNLTPRKYILEELSLAKQARELIMLYETHFGLPHTPGLTETQKYFGKWKNATILFKLGTQVKDAIRTMVR